MTAGVVTVKITARTAFGRSFRKLIDNNTIALIEELENENLIDLMHHSLDRYKSVNRHAINMNALWQKWIRS